MRIRRRFGQHFLHDPGIIRRIIETVDQIISNIDRAGLNKCASKRGYGEDCCGRKTAHSGQPNGVSIRFHNFDLLDFIP